MVTGGREREGERERENGPSLSLNWTSKIDSFDDASFVNEDGNFVFLWLFSLFFSSSSLFLFGRILFFPLLSFFFFFFCEQSREQVWRNQK